MSFTLPTKHTVFFTAEGESVSMSEANHVANLCGEISKSLASSIQSAGAFQETVNVDGNCVVLRNPSKIDLVEASTKEGEVYALSAWLREGIKAKDALLNLVQGADTDKFANEGEFPTYKIPNPPQLQIFTEDDAIGEFTIAERAEYYRLEAFAAHIGKRIHSSNKEDGVVAKVRDQVISFTPSRMVRFESGPGPKDYPSTCTLIYTTEEVDKAFFSLQELHREYNSKLNAFKARIKNLMTLRNTEYRKAYNQALNEYESVQESYRASINKFRSQMEERRLALVKQIAGYKIVIPNVLIDTLKFVRSYKG